MSTVNWKACAAPNHKCPAVRSCAMLINQCLGRFCPRLWSHGFCHGGFGLDGSGGLLPQILFSSEGTIFPTELPEICPTVKMHLGEIPWLPPGSSIFPWTFPETCFFSGHHIANRTSGDLGQGQWMVLRRRARNGTRRAKTWEGWL